MIREVRQEALVADRLNRHFLAATGWGGVDDLRRGSAHHFRRRCGRRHQRRRLKGWPGCAAHDPARAMDSHPDCCLLHIAAHHCLLVDQNPRRGLACSRKTALATLTSCLSTDPLNGIFDLSSPRSCFNAAAFALDPNFANVARASGSSLRRSRATVNARKRTATPGGLVALLHLRSRAIIGAGLVGARGCQLKQTLGFISSLDANAITVHARKTARRIGLPRSMAFWESSSAAFGSFSTPGR